MKLIRTSFLNGIAVLIRIVTLLGINKLLAIYVGPLGYAVLGQFQNAVTMITTFASGAINTGVTKYTAEHYDNEILQQKVWSTACLIALCGSFVSAILLIGFSKSLALWFLKDAHYWGVFCIFAIMLVFFVLNALLLAILNGKKEIKRYVVANISGSLFALLITTLLAIRFGLYGALIALSIYQSLTFFITLMLCYRADWFKISYFFHAFDKKIAKNLAKYTLMALSTATCVPISHILIRQYLGVTFSWEVAGYWEAMWRLSAAYLMLVTTTLSVYYLPKLSELRNPTAIKKEILLVYKFILPLAMISAVLMYYLRDFIITLLFTPEFYPVRKLFLGQVIGDVLKIGSWILSFVMLGKAMIKEFILTEILFSASFYLAVVWLTKLFGFEGISYAYAFNYLAYWIVLYFLIFRHLKEGNAICAQ
jgi:PST family polysaccharide transporter